MQFSAFDSLKVLARTSFEVSLISRYILRETFGAWLVVVAVLFLILMTNQFAEILGDAASDKLPREAVFSIFALTSLRYITALTPIALFLGVMLALARLNRDCEMAALSACGIGPGRLLVPIVTLTFVIAAVLSWLALVQTPAASARIEQIRFQAKQNVHITALEAGKFNTSGSGGTVLYPGEVVGDELSDVFYSASQGDKVVAILADRGKRVVDPATGQQSFVLYDGRWYEGVPGQSKFLVVEFDEQMIPVRSDDKPATFVQAVSAKPTSALLTSGTREDRAELQWRLSIPLSLFVLAILAVPLSRSSPRDGRYAKIGVGLLIYLIYTNLLYIARVWVERGLAPEWVGMWWVHVVTLAVAGVLLIKHSGVLARAPLVAPTLVAA